MCSVLRPRSIKHISRSLSVLAFSQFVRLWVKLQDVNLNASNQDKFIWKWYADQQYSASSAYRAFLVGQCALLGAMELSKTQAPSACKFSVWTSLLSRCWTSERMQRHGLLSDRSCVLCAHVPETVEHLLLSCVYSRETWLILLCKFGF
jgi:hypothetical protein